MSQPAKRSRFVTASVLLTGAAIASWFVFFRSPEAPAEAAPAALEAPVVAEVAPEILPPPPVEKAAPPPPPPAPPPPPPVPTVSQEIAALSASGKKRDARAALAARFAAEISDAERAELATKGIEINRQLLLEKPDEKEVELYEILQGDSLEGIARKFKALNGVKGSIMLVNNYKENSILRAGRKVKVAHGAWTILVDKTLFKLYLCYEGAPFKAYAVTIGSDKKPTPPAKYVVGLKNPKPAWWPPADMKTREVPVKYGDPQNPLGEWWVALDHDLHHGLGIHGTNDPGAMGTRASNGCVRMLNEEVVEVAAVAYKGMAVTVVE